jgi:hypothetical protein
VNGYNLAMFVYDSGSLPQFAFPSKGTTDVTDFVGANASNSMPRDVIKSVFMIGADARRTEKEAWTMEPIRDPHKLELMRCAYQHAVASCGIGSNEKTNSCLNCTQLLDDFHEHNKSSGGITATCIRNLGTGAPWFGAGSKDDVPDDCGCIYVGHYCDQYVWVLPEHRKQLTQLTLAILDYAVHEPPEVATKQVVTTVTTFETDKKLKVIGSVVTTTHEPVKEKVEGVDKDGNPVMILRNLYNRSKRTINPSGTNLRALQQELQQLR